MEKIAAFFINNWRSLLAVALTIIVACAAGLGRLQFDSDYKKFLSEDEQKELEDFDRTYTKDMGLLIAVSAKEGTLFTGKNLEVLEKLTADAWKIPNALRVDSLANFQYTRSMGDDLLVNDLVRHASQMSSVQVEQIKKIALNDPRLVNRLVSPNGQHTVIAVNLNLAEKDYDKLGASVKGAQALVQEINKNHPELKARTTGGAVVSWGVRELATEDTIRNIPLMNIFLFIVLWFFLRSVKGVALVFTVIGTSIVTALGLCGWFGIAISTISVMAPTIIMTLAVADSVHFLITFQRSLVHGMTKIEAVRYSIEHNYKPMFLTMLTTWVGFITMNFSDSPNYREFGNIVSIGVVFAFLYTCVLLPALIMLFPTDNWGQHSLARSETFSKKILNLRWLGEWVIKHNRFCLGAWVVGSVFLMAMIPNNRVDEDFLKLIDTSHELRQDIDFVGKNIVGFHTMQFNVKADGSDKVKDPQYLQFLDKFSRWLTEQPEIQQVISLADIVKNLNQVMNGDKKEFYVVPENQKLIAQYLLLYELALPQGLDLTNMVNADKSASRMIVSLHNLTNIEMVGLADRAQDWVQKNKPPVIKEARDAGASLAFSRVNIDNIWNMIEGELITIAAICILMGLLFRPMIVGFISIIPNFMPALCGLGMWGLTYKEVGMAVSSVFGLTLGIAIDDTVHFVSHYVDMRRFQGLSSKEALLISFEESAPSMLATTLILSAGFGTMALSKLNMNVHFGLLTTWIFFFAILGDYFLLGPLLLIFDRKKY